MPGIFVSCGSGSKEFHSEAATRLMRSACRVVSESAVQIDRTSCALSVTHHGLLRSSGAAVGDNTAITCLGSFWLTGMDDVLSTPEQLRHRVEAIDDMNESAASGVFCYAFWDTSRKRLLVEAEKTGSYSVYYFNSPGGLFVSTDIKSFVASGIHPGSLDLLGIGEYLALGYLASDRTFFDGIRRVPPGCRLVWKDGRTSLHQIWRYRLERSRPLNDELLDELVEILRRNLRRYSRERQPFCLTLSGGLDSRILAAAAKDCSLDFKTVSVGPVGSLECRVARQIACKLDKTSIAYEYDGEHASDWLPSMVWLTEGRCPPAHIHYFDMMFSGTYPGGTQIHGMVGDAVLGGSNYYPGEQWDESTRSRIDSCGSIVSDAQTYWSTDSKECFSEQLLTAMESTVARVTQELVTRYDDVGSGGGKEAFRYWFRGAPLLGTALSAQVVPWVDIICPFADPDLIDLAGQISGEDIFERNVQYRMVYRHWPHVATVPRIVDGIAISMSTYDPREYDRKVRYRNIRNAMGYYLRRVTRGQFDYYDRSGFHDFGRWYRKDKRLRQLFADTMHGRLDASADLWNPKRVLRMMGKLERGVNLWPAVGAIVFLELYLQQLLELKGPSGVSIHPGATRVL